MDKKENLDYCRRIFICNGFYEKSAYLYNCYFVVHSN